MFAIAIIFLILMELISFPFIKKSSTEEGYFVSSRKLGTITLSFTLAATTIGGSAVVVSLKLISKYGIWGILADVFGGLGLIVLSFTLSEKVRKSGALTLPSMLKNNLNKTEYKIIATALIIAEICWIALSIKSIKIIGNFNNFETAIITLLILGYSLLGGQWSVSKTDIVQFLLIVIGLAFFLPRPVIKTFSINKLPDSFPIYLAVLMLLSHIIGPDIYSKLLSAKDEKTARKGAFYSGILKIVFSLLLLISIAKGFSVKNINLLVFIIVFSAITSSIDSMLVTSTSIICEDILKTKNTRIIKLTTVFVSVIPFLLAIFTPNIISLLAAGYTVLLIAITFPVLSFFLFDKIKPVSVITPPLIFAIVFLLTKSNQYSFFSSIIFGGLTLAYTKVYS